MLSWYGFEFENIDGAGDSWGSNPNLNGYNMVDKPLFGMTTGFITLQLSDIRQLGQVGYSWSSTAADISRARDLVFQNGHIWDAARHNQSYGLSLRCRKLRITVLNTMV